MTHERNLMRIGGTGAMAGVVLAVGAAMLGPLDLDSHDIPAVLQTFADAAGRMHLHGLGVSLGTLLVLGGFVALKQSLMEGPAAAWARLGLAGAVVMTVIHLIGAMMGGSVMPALAEAFVTAPAEEAAALLHVGGGFYTFYEALLAPTFLTLAATVLLFGVAILKAPGYPRWLGWAAVVPGLWTATGAIAFVLAGPIGAADIMLLFVPGFMLAMVWVFAAGLFMWRMAGAPELPADGRRPLAEEAPGGA